MRTRLPVVGIAAALALAGCSSGGEQPTPSAAPGPSMGAAPGGSGMAMGPAPECPATANLPAPPKRVITMDAAAAAFLVQLGVGNRVIGTSGTDFKAEFTGDTRAALDAIPVMDERVANREAVIAAKPDLVTGISVYELGSFDGTATEQQLRDNGIAAVIACDITPSGETTGIDATYAYITELARVFQVPQRGEELIASLRQQIAAVTPAAQRNVPVLTLTAPPSGGVGINTAGGSSLTNGVITLAGGRNIAAGALTDFATLSAEQVNAADPAVIVAVTGLGDETPEQLVTAIKASPLLANTRAVRDDRVVVVPQTILYAPSPLNPQAVQTIAAAVASA